MGSYDADIVRNIKAHNTKINKTPNNTRKLAKPVLQTGQTGFSAEISQDGFSTVGCDSAAISMF